MPFDLLPNYILIILAIIPDKSVVCGIMKAENPWGYRIRVGQNLFGFSCFSSETAILRCV